jgi:hypothetical protein
MRHPHDQARYIDAIDAERLRAAPRTIAAGWLVLVALLAVSALPSVLSPFESSLIATARATYLDLRQSIARAPAPAPTSRADVACSEAS